MYWLWLHLSDRLRVMHATNKGQYKRKKEVVVVAYPIAGSALDKIMSVLQSDSVVLLHKTKHLLCRIALFPLRGGGIKFSSLTLKALMS